MTDYTDDLGGKGIRRAVGLETMVMEAKSLSLHVHKHCCYFLIVAEEESSPCFQK